jgi:tetratricopeptide (TPR) repeat protein
MTGSSCTMAPLIGARREGRLGEREIASLERHLVGCERCRAAAARLERIAERVRQPIGAPVSALEHQRRRLELLRTAALPRPRRALPRARVVVLLAAAALVALAALALAAPRRAAVVPLALHLPRVALPARVETIVRASAGARYERSTTAGTDRVVLHDGALDLEVRPLLPDERFVVATSDAEVEVRGTIFRVEARDGLIGAVSVREGKVEVRQRGASVLLTAGGAWSPGAPPLAQAAAPQVETPAPPARPAPARPAPARPTPAKATPAKDFADGVGLIERGDYAAAAEKLDAFRAANPGDARAEDAAYLGIIALQRAGRRPAAVAAAQRYLALYPQHPRSPAVRAILDER